MKSNKSAEVFKTEDQLKAEAKARIAAEQAQLDAAAPKSERQKKRENFWYHYKWHSIGGAFLALLLVFFLRDFLQPRPDVTLIMIGGSCEIGRAHV